MSSTAVDLERCLARFGLKSFRLAQREVISAVLAGQDCLCIMPTGGGKSLCYQLPAIARDGVTLVISPLIALMKDQVDSLAQLEIRATFINSSLGPAEQQLRLEQMAGGGYDLVYVAPERLRSPRFLELVRRTRVQLLAVDEAHCVSEWGHDFRPDYARLGKFRQRLGFPQTIALTATATPEVRDDIALMLDLRDPQVFVSGFARDNLRFEVQDVSNGREKDERLLEFLRETPGAGIVYASSRRRCEDVRQLIAEQLRLNVGVYHAGLLAEDRRRVQEDFMADRLQIIVATNAFGMGIDKSDLRFVVHYNMPGTLEAYYQEAGRAGRDGLPSRCLLLYTYQDRFIQEFFIDNAYPSREMVGQVYEYLRSLDEDPIEITLEDLKERLELPIGAEGVGACERLLEKAGGLERLDSGDNMASVRILSDQPSLIDVLPRDANVQRKVLRWIEREVGDRRGERVYFHPHRIAAESGMDREAVLRALRELNRLQSLDYVPAFRGRAVHVVDRSTRFEQLEIDFDELAARRKAEYDKLERVIHFARCRRCRQLEILEYFGDPDRRPCGRCDNCARRGATPGPVRQATIAAADDAQILTAVRMALSGVARAQGRFGKTVVAQMLCGSKSAKMTKFRLDTLSTFGLLSQLTQSDVTELLDALQTVGLIEQSAVERHRPIVRLTELGGQVMRGQTALPDSVALPAAVACKLSGKPGPAGLGQPAADEPLAAGRQAEAWNPTTDEPLWEIDPQLENDLRQWRRETAAALAWPAYRVLTNAALQRLAAIKPASRAELLEIKGIGETTARIHGKALLAIIAGHPPAADHHRPDAAPGREGRVQEPADVYEDGLLPADLGEELVEPSGDAEPAGVLHLPEPDRSGERLREPAAAVGSTVPQARAGALPAAARALENGGVRPDFYWTWRLLWDGFTAAQCREIRHLDEPQLISHLLQALDHQLPVEPDWLLRPEQLARLAEVIGDEPPQRLRPVLQQLPKEFRREHVQFYLRCRGTG